MDSFLGEIRLFAGNFAPRSWAFCDGQLLPIAQNQALFSILGTTYGGDGKTTFALPDLRGRVPVHAGQGPGLTPYNQGQRAGTEQVTLTTSQLPSHRHQLQVAGESGDTKQPSEGFLAAGSYRSTADALAPTGAITETGGNQPVSLIQPVLALRYILCIQGIFPSRD